MSKYLWVTVFLILVSVVAISAFKGESEIVESRYASGAIQSRLELNESGQMHGRCTEFYESGQVKMDGTYSHDQWVEVKEYDESGKLVRHMYYDWLFQTHNDHF